jgi:hypothetical protein
MKAQSYRNPLNLFYLAFGCLLIVVVGLSLVDLLTDLISGAGFSPSNFVNLVGIVLPGFFSVITFNWAPDIELYQSGLRVQSFGLFWVWVPWETIAGLVEPADVGYYLRGILVRCERLTVFHRLVALFFGIGTTPAFIISDGLCNYDSLVEIVRLKWEESLS